MSVRSKLENIWYHYKSHIIVSLFLIGTVIFALQSCVTKSEFDIKVYYLAGSSSMYTEQLAWVEDAVASVCGDVDGDGEVNVSVTGLRVGQYADTSTLAQYMTAVQAGEVMLFFGDQDGIQYLYENNYLQPLTAYTEDADGKDYAWKVNGSPFSEKTPGFEMFSDVDIYLSLRVFNDTWSASLASGQHNYDVACNTLRTIVSMQSEFDLRSYYLAQDASPTAEQTAWIHSLLSSVCSDRNGNGTVLTDVVGLDLSKSSTFEKYMNAVSAENRYLLFGDEKAIATLASENLLVSLEPYSASSLDSTGCGFLLNNAEITSSVKGFEVFGEGKVYIALRQLGEDPTAEQKALYEDARNIITGIMPVIEE